MPNYNYSSNKVLIDKSNDLMDAMAYSICITNYPPRRYFVRISGMTWIAVTSAQFDDLLAEHTSWRGRLVSWWYGGAVEFLEVE